MNGCSPENCPAAKESVILKTPFDSVREWMRFHFELYQIDGNHSTPLSGINRTRDRVKQLNLSANSNLRFGDWNPTGFLLRPDQVGILSLEK